MLKKFTLKNYKHFKDEITIDFENIAGYQFNTDCLSDGIIGKMLIYGRNATGKTNLGRAILDIGSTMFGGTRYASNGILLNADSKEDALNKLKNDGYTDYLNTVVDDYSIDDAEFDDNPFEIEELEEE